MNKQQKEIVKTVERAFCKLHILDNISTRHHRENLLRENIKGEKMHRSFGRNWAQYHKNTASITQCAKMFVVKDICVSLLDENKWKVSDIIHVKETVIVSQSIVQNYKAQIKEALKDEDIQYLASLDYVALVDWEQYQKHQEVA